MIDRVAFTVFGKDIYWYGILIATAMLAGILLARKTAKHAGMDPDSIFDIALLAVPLAIIGARIYYVAFTWDYYSQMPFSEVFKVWNGGMAIYGGVIGGVVGVWIYSRWKKVKMLTLLDVLAPCLILGQAIGRWGNFVNQEAFGYVVSNPALQFFPLSVYIQNEGVWHLATFFYESIWDFGVFAFLMFYTFRKKEGQPGHVFLYYLLLYGLGRMFIEGLRTDSLYFLNIRVSQWVSGVMVLTSLGILIAGAVKRRKAAASPQAAAAPAQEADDEQPAQEAAQPEQAPAAQQPEETAAQPDGQESAQEEENHEE
ncbi:MAG: prolipoprotein diacylglyceryl transferase [Eubacteriales bacterium]|nr:prolipoprotein diacylglyceryl transferase [Eubacteriales bacterium]